MKNWQKINLFILVLFLSNCDGDSTGGSDTFTNPDDFIITVVQTIPGIKVSFADFKEALLFSNIPANALNSEEINGFLQSGYLNYISRFIDVVEVMHPTTTATSFNNTDTANVTYQYVQSVGGVYVIKFNTLIPEPDAEFEEMLEANVQQNYRSAYIEIDIGVVSKLVSFLATNPENEVDNTGQLRINYRIHGDRIEVNYELETLLGGSTQFDVDAFGILYTNGSGKSEWTVETSDAITDNCWSWDSSGTLTDCSTN